MRRFAPWLPVAAALAVWAAASALVLHHVLEATDFVMSEVRAHGLVADLVRALVAFAPPYAAAGALSAWIACGVRRLASREKPEAGWADGLLGCVTLGALMGGITAWGIVERPALFAGLLYGKGGMRRSLQLALEAHASAGGIARALAAVTAIAVAVAAAGYFRHATAARRKAVAATVGIAVIAIGAARTARALRSPATGGAPNVLIVLVDSMRPEDVAPGSGAPAAPRIAALAARGAWFADAHTPCALTYPSVASLMTGRHPIVHGVRTIYPDHASRELPMPGLARLFAASGWRTIAVSGYCGTVFRELELGFERQLTPRGEADLIVSAAALRGHPWLPVVLRSPWARAVWPEMRTAVEGSDPDDIAHEAVAAWRHERGRFFMTVFFDNAHLPYVPVWPDSAGSGAYAGPNRYSVTAGDLVEQVREGEAATLAREHDEEADQVRRLHRGAIASVDRAIGGMLDALDHDGLASDTIVLVMSDHGENLLAAGGPLAHGEAVERDRSASIPWVLAWPGRIAPQKVSEAVTVLDVMPTLLDLAGLPPVAGLDGTTLAPRVLAGKPIPERPVLFETGMWFFSKEAVERLDPGGDALYYPAFTEGLLDVEAGKPPHIVITPGNRQIVNRAKHRRLEFGPWALTCVPRRSGARFRLFRRDVDPDLTHDVAAENPAKLQEMIALFEAEARRLGDRDVPPAPSAPAPSPPHEQN